MTTTLAMIDAGLALAHAAKCAAERGDWPDMLTHLQNALATFDTVIIAHTPQQQPD